MRRRQFIAGIAGLATFPLAGRALAANTPVVGVLSFNSPGPMMASRIDGFLRGLSELQYVAGRNVSIEYRWAEFHGDRLPALADDLVKQQVAVIATFTRTTALAAKAATASIPIVFSVGDDPVQAGLVASMNRPGANATGVSMFTGELDAKRLGLLQEMVPASKTVGFLVNSNNVNRENQTHEAQSAAAALGLRLHVGSVGSDADIDVAFEALVGAGARMLLVAADPFFAGRRDKLVSLATKHGLPSIWEWAEFVEGGGLMSYGTSIIDTFRQVGVYAGRILKGENPADLPVTRPVKFELAINLKTARTLGIEVPATLLARADQVIE
jgi:putative tryptophan/tyrosine transport system substrate-binding protein